MLGHSTHSFFFFFIRSFKVYLARQLYNILRCLQCNFFVYFVFACEFVYVLCNVHCDIISYGFTTSSYHLYASYLVVILSVSFRFVFFLNCDHFTLWQFIYMQHYLLCNTISFCAFATWLSSFLTSIGAFFYSSLFFWSCPFFLLLLLVEFFPFLACIPAFSITPPKNRSPKKIVHKKN